MTAVSVVIPTHNRRQLLERTLTSVLAQRAVDLEVVVVDDGGSDGTTDWLRQHPDPRLIPLRHERARGVSAARNSGIAQATSPWLAFIDDDDLWAPDKLRRQLEAIVDHGTARWACTGSVGIDDSYTVLNLHLPPMEDDLGDRLLIGNCVPGGGSGVLADAELTRRIGGFDEALSNLADWDFYIRLGLHSPVAAVHRPDLGYYIHPTGMAHDVLRSERECRYLDVKYERPRRDRGVVLDEASWLGYLATLAYGSGQRLTGIRLHAELAFRLHRWRSLATMAMGLAPTRLREARARRWWPAAPPTEELAWLEPYAAASGLAAQGR